MDDLLDKQWAVDWTRNLPAFMVGMATELCQYGSDSHISDKTEQKQERMCLRAAKPEKAGSRRFVNVCPVCSNVN